MCVRGLSLSSGGRNQTLDCAIPYLGRFSQKWHDECISTAIRSVRPKKPSARFRRGAREIVRDSVIKGDWASSEGRLVLGFVLIVVSGARITRRLAGFSVADRVVRMVGRRIVFAGLGVGPGPIVTLGVVELVAARFAPGRIRGVRGPGRVQDGSRSRGRDEDDGEDAQQGIYQFDTSYEATATRGIAFLARSSK